MDRGWVKHYRRELDSEIFQMPPLYCKVWQWLKLSVDRRTGSLRTTPRQLAREVQYQERGAPRIPNHHTIMVVLSWLEDRGMISQVRHGVGNAVYTDVTLCNWDIYQHHDAENVTQPSRSQAAARHTVQELEKLEKTTVPPLIPLSGGDHDPELPPNQPDQPPSQPKQTARQRVESSPHAPFLTDLGRWFHALPHTINADEGSPEWWAGLDACRQILDSQMDRIPSPNGTVTPEERLRKILRYAVEDEPQTPDAFGWKMQVRSLRSLAVAKRAGLPKWANVESAMVAHPSDEERRNRRMAVALTQEAELISSMEIAENTHTSPDDLDRLSASTNVDVRGKIAANPNTSPETLDRLRQDQNH